MRDHLKMMWMCVAIVAVAAAGAVAAGFDVAYAVLFGLPCLLMMGAMAWMMVRMARSGGDDHR